MALTNSQYDSIMREYDAKQSRNRAVLKEKTDRLYAADPRFAEIDAKIAEISVSQARRYLEGDSGAIKRLKAQLASLKNQRLVLLADMGYKPEDFEMSYTCPDCKDTGMIGDRRCHCFEQAAIDLLYTQSNVRRILEEENFDRLSLEYYSKELKHPYLEGMTAYNYAAFTVVQCKKFVENFGKEYQNILFQGPVGVGKTFLSHCIARELIDSRHSVIYFTANDLFETFRKEAFDKDDDAEEQVDHIYDCDLLIIDDLGTEFRNSFTVSRFFSLVDRRIQQKKSMIISTNLTQEQIVDLYSERTASRIFSNFANFHLIGDDIRLLKKAGSFTE